MNMFNSKMPNSLFFKSFLFLAMSINKNKLTTALLGTFKRFGDFLKKKVNITREGGGENLTHLPRQCCLGLSL